MASDVQICNMALGHIGNEALVSSIAPPDGSAEAGYCAAYYGQSRTEMLEVGNWKFSLARSVLTAVANPSGAWAYAYAVPSDCLRALRIPNSNEAVGVFSEYNSTEFFDPTDRNGASFDIESGVLFTNSYLPTLLYVRDVTDSAKFTASFTSAFSYLLASYLAGPIIKGNEGVRVGDAMRQRAMAMADTSATASANASSATNDAVPDVIRARY